MTDQGTVPCPVIVHSSLKHSEVNKLLQQCHLKVRFTESTQEHSCIFPTSGCAFLILPLTATAICWPPGEATVLSQDIICLLEKFRQIHRRCYVLCVAAIHEEQETNIFSALQQRFLCSNLKLVPAHNAAECVQAMLTIVQGLLKPSNDVSIKQSVERQLASQLTGGVLFHTLATLALSEHERYILEDALGTLSAVAAATREQLLDCSLDTATADKILKFFKK